MKKLIETLRSLGIEVPEDKESEVRKKLSENYKNVAEVEKTTGNLESDRDTWKKRAEEAEETLKKFEGIDPEAIQTELTTWKKKAENAEKDYAAKLEQRDFEDALKEAISGYKFTSEAAKRAVIADIREAGLKVKDGKILGLNDLIAQMKEKDSSAFVNEEQENLEQNRARFTQPLNQGKQQTSKEKFADMSLDERMKLKSSDPAAYERMRNS